MGCTTQNRGVKRWLLELALNFPSSSTDAELVAALDARGGGLDLRGIYRRPNGDSSTLPVRGHLRWIAADRRYTLVRFTLSVSEVKKQIRAYRVGRGELVVTDDGQVVRAGAA